jgi:RNA polymerase sigma-70 factor (ECF subfamily)
MNTQVLTLEQQSFAADHHGLVYGFLKAKRLRRDEFYDVVVFGYLRAVRKYLNREDLRRRYAFSTIAWRAMECDLGHHYEKNARHMRRAHTVSLESTVYDGESLTVAETVSGADRMMEQLEASFLWDEIKALIPRNQAEALRMKLEGYTPHEIAGLQNLPVGDINALLDDALTSAHALCFA